MEPYAVYIHEQVVEFVRAHGGGRAFRDFTQLLGRRPFMEGDIKERDSAGFVHEIIVWERYSIAFRADHAVKEVKVSGVRLADR